MTPDFVERVLRIVSMEQDGDHYLSHYIFARKCLRENTATAIGLARAYGHHPLTRIECEGLIADWAEFNA